MEKKILNKTKTGLAINSKYKHSNVTGVIYTETNKNSPFSVPLLSNRKKKKKQIKYIFLKTEKKTDLHEKYAIERIIKAIT